MVSPHIAPSLPPLEPDDTDLLAESILGLIEADSRVDCPLCCGDLRSVSQVGALTWKGSRFEPVLYHVSCITAMLFHGGNFEEQTESKEPKINWGLSPSTRKETDGFLLIPPLLDEAGWMRFAIWREDGQVSISDVATAGAVALSVSVHHVQRALRSKLGCNDLISPEHFRLKGLPSLWQLGNLLPRAPPSAFRPLLDDVATARYAELLLSHIEFRLRIPSGRSDEIVSVLKALQKNVKRGNPRATKIVAALLEEEDNEIRLTAIEVLRAIVQCGDEVALDVVRPMFTHSRRCARIAALEMLPFVVPVGHEEGTKFASTSLQDRDASVRQVAAGIVARVATNGDDVAVTLLCQASNDHNDTVRGAALRALGKVAKSGDAKVMSAIYKLLEDDNFRMRRDAIVALGQLASAADVQAQNTIYKLVKDTDPDVRWGCVIALPYVVRRGDTKAIATLLALANEKETWLRSAVMSSLGQVVPRGHKRGHKVLTAAVGDKQKSVSQSAMKALLSIEESTDEPRPSSLMPSFCPRWIK